MTDRNVDKPNVLVIIGSASRGSSNTKLMEVFEKLMYDDLLFTFFDDLGSLPHFDPSMSDSLLLPVAEENCGCPSGYFLLT